MVKQMFGKKVISVMIISAMLTPCFAVMADDDDADLQNQLSDVQSQMDQQAQKKNEAEAVIGSVFEKLRVTQENLDAALKEFKTVSDQLAQTEEQITKTQAELEKTQANLSRRQDVLSTRIRDIYMHGQLNYLDVVIGAKDFSDFSNRVELLKRIVNSDMELITSIKDERDKINEQKAVLEQERQKQVELKAESAKKKEEVEKRKAEQQAILNKAQNDKATAEQAYNELEASSQQIGDMLRSRAAARAVAASGSDSSGGGSDSSYYQPVSGSGRFIWPVNGVITSPFGYRNHPIFGRQILHSGIDIGVDSGTPVHAADSGVVVEAGWLGGYGYAVVIDHGNGLSTLYGHNSSLNVSAGQSVSQGQVIAYSGSTGNSTGPHVHFEVRANGDPVDPTGYL
ncbi:peptidoglycan DD-metalloendopeptidase family protein [Megasphaera paucivorans]|uniref:Septal ring factor EnvC, activator of murein hydrolases AmiA and AmiB n=1 Tax=Megasphaera paucivorans TaxID=349095 RepID=A0A1G9YHU0_9FIRM|nr:M23 family metallopeptidase [Megasphaera paucivorans]SDN08758.1 Septal ring factor EnvC, activator of murein hydrolases AmiA and AmiB [Megasphaera paucivorans]